MFCPSCGEEKEKFIGKICSDCYVRDKELTKIPDYLDVEFCVNCGSFKDNGNWTEPGEDSKIEAAESAVMSSLGVHKEVKNLKIALDSVVSNDQVDVEIEVVGEVNGEPISLKDSTKVRLNKTSCNRCSKISGGYFESIVQIRGENRGISENEKFKIREEVNSLLKSINEERMGFISEIKEIDQGIDIYVGNSRLGKKISRVITEKFGGSYSKSASLIGMEDGQEVHRVTYSVRLPPFKSKDIVEIGGKVIGITSVGKIIEGINIENGKPYKRNWKYIKDKEMKKIGDKRNLKKGTISLISGNEVQIIEPWDFKNISLRKPEFLTKDKEGKKISMLKYDRDIYLLPKEFSKDLK